MVLLQAQSKFGNVYMSFCAIYRKTYAKYARKQSYKYIQITMYIVSNKCDKWRRDVCLYSVPYKLLGI